ncbi:NADH-quinone oxidoreductase subunit L [Dinghuibacter silviterrae]|uniref:NADH dehydrogenase subunit L n=1 Tax=Dinghuibacter silviterrae TaxID=1539049 RepID=A0A4R8DNJ6_9BACT|nr:NADH-quinone oxidoreductase subunit L [Dinghuibacter silviterrae]TDW99285.1 NADH dehydrogenase subunit L [Dinghuibacter silviterrae]
MSQFVYLVPLFPLVGFLVIGLGRNVLSRTLTGLIGCATVLASFVVSVMIFNEVRTPGFMPVTVRLFDFIHTGSLNISFAFQVDQLSSLFLLIITGVGSLIHIYSTSYMHEEKPHHFARYFSYLNLFVFSMLLLVLGANYVILFIGWEGVGLCSYLLIGFWFTNGDYNYAARKAFIMNRIGDLAFLIGIFWILAQFGSLNYADVFTRCQGGATAPVLTGITLLLFIGATGKSAQIPLYTWLPDAMAGPTPVSALIHAATMVTAGIYMIARSNVMYTLAPATQAVIAVIGLCTAILAASIAIQQNDIKKVLAYSTVSQLGYMFLGLGVGAYTGAVFHVMTHAFFKALLFLGAGSVIHAMGGEQDIRKMGGLRKYMPVTYWTFWVGTFAIAGIFPFAGFFSKDEILSHAYAHNPVLYAVGLLGSLFTAFYMFRLLSLTFLGKFRGTHEQEHHLHESPAAITIPLVILAVLAIFAGFLGIPEYIKPDAHILEKFLAPVFASSQEIAASASPAPGTEWVLTIVSLLLIAAVSIWGWTKFKGYTGPAKEATGFAKILENKWYVDELYDAVIVRPINALAGFLNKYVERGLDGIVNGAGRLVQYSSRQIRLLQSGQVGAYVLLMVIGVIILFIVQIFL